VLRDCSVARVGSVKITEVLWWAGVEISPLVLLTVLTRRRSERSERSAVSLPQRPT